MTAHNCGQSDPYSRCQTIEKTGLRSHRTILFTVSLSSCPRISCGARFSDILNAHDTSPRCEDDDRWGREKCSDELPGADEVHASARREDDAWFVSLRDDDEAPLSDALRKRTTAKPASTEIPRNAAGWRFAKSVALSTMSRKLPLRIFSAASSTYSAAESMPRAAKGASFSKARAASRMLPANRSMKSAPDRCFSRASLWSWSAVPEDTSLAASAASLNSSSSPPSWRRQPAASSQTRHQPPDPSSFERSRYSGSG